MCACGDRSCCPPLRLMRFRNQPPPLDGVRSSFASDTALKGLCAAGRRRMGTRAPDGVSANGLANPKLGVSESRPIGIVPELRTYDRFGHRIDEVEFSSCMASPDGPSCRRGKFTHCRGARPKKGAHVVRAASAFMLNQIEAGVCCPNGHDLRGDASPGGRARFHGGMDPEKSCRRITILAISLSAANAARSSVWR